MKPRKELIQLHFSAKHHEQEENSPPSAKGFYRSDCPDCSMKMSLQERKEKKTTEDQECGKKTARVKNQYEAQKTKTVPTDRVESPETAGMESMTSLINRTEYSGPVSMGRNWDRSSTNFRHCFCKIGMHVVVTLKTLFLSVLINLRF